MKNLSLFFLFFLPIFCFGQVNDSFSDGNFINNPFWTGNTANFIVNSSFQLQANVQTAGTSSLFTASEAFENAQWECGVKIQYSTSSGTTSTSPYNYSSIYLATDKSDITNGFNGYFVKIGDAQDDVSLWLKVGTNIPIKIIDGKDARSQGNPIEMRIKVTRDVLGNFSLYSKLSTETDFYLEGTTQNNVVKNSNFFGVSFTNTAKTGTSYYFDDIVVTGTKAVDRVAPLWTSFTLEQPNKLNLIFSEPMDFTKATYILEQSMGNPVSQVISTDKTAISLTFATNFERGKIYNLQTTGLTDLAQNALVIAQKWIGIIEKTALGDLILNEVMFENPLNSLEYLEIYNTSNKLLDVSGLVFTTRKTDGSLNTGNIIPPQTTMLPKGCLAVCSNAETVRNFHACPSESNIVTTSWSTLNNESSTIVLTNAAKDTIYDELNYNVKWHNAWVKDPKGIALERNAPELPTQNSASWHSSVSAPSYGTPGYKNSEFIDLVAPICNTFTLIEPNILNLVFSEAMDFSKATFTVDNNIGNPSSQAISLDKSSIELSFTNNFEKGKIYKLTTLGLTDLVGNAVEMTQQSIGITEKFAVDDLIFNEVMFDNPTNSVEYIELYNKSDKLLDVSGLVFTTRKTDGSLNTGNIIPAQTRILPNGYVALCSDAELLRNYHNCPAESNIVNTDWTTLNNESATLVLTNSEKDSIYDELTYNVKWHHALVKYPKGVALERIHPSLPTQDAASWHSAATEVNYGTPGYKNSQYRDISNPALSDKFVWLEPESFSPDNDGVEDVCFIHYKTETDGFMAKAVVLNAVGVKVFQLASNILLSSEGFLTWDGKTDAGKNANVGVYVLYFEIFNPLNGQRKQVKLPIVVSSR
ncbi:MAG: lamin tail domain-containing protein [Paludibacter sp.]